jgi:hypothetical protein
MGVRGRGTVCLGVAIGVLAAVAGSASAANKPAKIGPDLVISDWKVDQAKPYFIRVGSAGGELFVKVTTENIGNRRSKKSVTLLGLTHNGRAVALKEVNVGPLKPGQASTESAALHVDEIGWMVPEGKANATKVPETNTHNNGLHLPSFKIPALANTWTIEQLETKSVVPSVQTVDTQLVDGTFRLSGWSATNEEWVYEGWGTVNGSTNWNPAPQCSAKGTGTTPLTPAKLTQDTLKITRDLNGYTALIATSRLPGYKLALSCGGATAAPPGGYEDLTTIHIGPAFEFMKEDDQTLSGSFPIPAKIAGGTTTITWKFFANI